MKHLKFAIPVLASLNIDKTVTFYKEKLGFDKIGWKDKNYAVIGRDKVEIHFWKCNNKIHPENTSCYIQVEEVDELYEEMKIAGVVHPNGPLQNQPWGMREFAVLDKDGNMIKFGQFL
ncbi:bleomycin resistance protein [uncultured Croceitalea sp.]|uniref:bleomycin resistance protein n=1 Tax=uncultured Croceitalea sp. TaxID=1798908 RepID=UPI00374F6F57